jgi:tetratricopeptide (TPR) repeat protein
LQIVEQKNPGASPPQYLLANRARALEALGRYQQAREAYEACLPKAPGGAVSDLFCMLGIAGVEHARGNLAAAEEYLAKTAAAINPQLPPGFPARTTLHLIRAKVAIQRKQFQAAHEELDPVFATARQPTLLLTASLVRGELSLAENRLPAALEDARTAVSLAKQLQGGVQHSNRVGQALLFQARVLASMGDEAQAQQAAETARRNRR